MMNERTRLIGWDRSRTQDGRIDYNEFVAMMRKGNPEQNLKKRRDVVL